MINNYVDASFKSDSKLKKQSLNMMFLVGLVRCKRKNCKDFTTNNHTVGFVGDGVNDVLALKLLIVAAMEVEVMQLEMYQN